MTQRRKLFSGTANQRKGLARQQKRSNAKKVLKGTGLSLEKVARYETSGPSEKALQRMERKSTDANGTTDVIVPT